MTNDIKSPKVGQVRKSCDEGEVFIITKIEERENCMVYHSIFVDGFVIKANTQILVTDELIAEYPTWQEAVNSKEFNLK